MRTTAAKREAHSVTFWKSSFRAHRLLQRKFSRSVATLQVSESVDWSPTRTGSELQETSSFLCRPTPDDFPKPGHDWILSIVTSVLCVLLPVLDIDRFDSSNQELGRHIRISSTFPSATKERCSPLVPSRQTLSTPEAAQSPADLSVEHRVDSRLVPSSDVRITNRCTRVCCPL